VFSNTVELDISLQIIARDASAKYANDHMKNAERFNDRDTMLKSAVEKTSSIRGCICEFGVYSGNSLNVIAASAPNKKVYGFDSFEGLPTDWRPGFSKGAFKTGLPEFQHSNVHLKAGWFDATLPKFLKTLDEPISMAHIDCDLYSSTKCVLESISRHLAPGAILVFDEYFNYPSWEEHEHRALQESVASGLFKHEYLGYNVHGQQVMVGVNTFDGSAEEPFATNDEPS
jgi:predicted O-methyltransferase YrrM